MDEWSVVLLMVGLPIAGVVVLAAIALLAGRRIRRLRREGRIRYRSTTSPDSNSNFTSSGM